MRAFSPYLGGARLTPADADTAMGGVRRYLVRGSRPWRVPAGQVRPARSPFSVSSTLWDHACMGENTQQRTGWPANPEPAKTASSRGVDRYGNPVTEQLRIIGQRRREAEEKLERHLQAARTRH